MGGQVRNKGGTLQKSKVQGGGGRHASRDLPRPTEAPRGDPRNHNAQEVGRKHPRLGLGGCSKRNVSPPGRSPGDPWGHRGPRRDLGICNGVGGQTCTPGASSAGRRPGKGGKARSESWGPGGNTKGRGGRGDPHDRAPRIPRRGESPSAEDWGRSGAPAEPEAGSPRGAKPGASGGHSAGPGKAGPGSGSPSRPPAPEAASPACTHRTCGRTDGPTDRPTDRPT